MATELSQKDREVIAFLINKGFNEGVTNDISWELMSFGAIDRQEVAKMITEGIYSSNDSFNMEMSIWKFQFK